MQIIKWLLEKLLGSFIISALIVWGPIFGLNLTKFGLGTVYTVVTAVTFTVSLIIYFLVPRSLEKK